MPTINILLFTCIYSRIAVHLDAATAFSLLYNTNRDEPTGYVYQNSSVLWLLSTTSFAALNITCNYISSTLAHLLVSFIVINQSHMVFKATIKGVAIILNIAQIIVTVIVNTELT